MEIVLLLLILLCLLPKAIWQGLGWLIGAVVVVFIVTNNIADKRERASKAAKPAVERTMPPRSYPDYQSPEAREWRQQRRIQMEKEK